MQQKDPQSECKIKNRRSKVGVTLESECAQVITETTQPLTTGQIRHSCDLITHVADHADPDHSSIPSLISPTPPTHRTPEIPAWKNNMS